MNTKIVITFITCMFAARRPRFEQIFSIECIDKADSRSSHTEFLRKVFVQFKMEKLPYASEVIMEVVTRISNNFLFSAIVSFKLLEIIYLIKGTAPFNALLKIGIQN